MKKTLWTLWFLAMLAVSLRPMADARLLRFPDVNGDRVVFVYAGDIWTVSASGGVARRLTSHEGKELFPKISPDGRWIAYSAEYSGSRQVYVMPAEGGAPRQLTWYNDVGILPPRGGYDYVVLDWTPDSRSILVRANRTPWLERMGKYFLVSLDGGLERPLQIPEAGGGRFSPDGKKIVYTPIEREFRTWKRTKGGRAQDVWIYDLERNESKRITDFPGTDQHPLWYKDKIYFVSDRDLVLNFYSYDLASGRIEQVTRHADYDALWPSGRFGRVVYEKGGALQLLDLDSGVSRALKVDLDFDSAGTLPVIKNVSAFVSRFGFALSPAGKRAAFDARGDIFTVPAEHGRTDNLTRSQGVREYYPSWSPDGRWIACYSDESGEPELVLLDPSGREKPRALTAGTRVWKYPALWSPDSRKLLFSDKNQLLQWIDVASGKISVIDRADLFDITDYAWSPDSRWVVYGKNAANSQSALWVYNLESGQTRQLLASDYNNGGAVFSRCGRYIYFLSQRDFKMNFSDFEFDFVYNESSRIYAVALTAAAPDPFREKNDVEEIQAAAPVAKPPKAAAEPQKTAAPSEPKPVQIDFAGIDQRVAAFPLPAGNYQAVEDLGGKIAFVRAGEVHVYDLDSRKDETVIRGIDTGAISGDGKKLLYRAGADWGIIDLKPNQKPGDGKLNLQDVSMRIEPEKEWRQIFREGWRIYRDWFYVKNMHGVDWEQMRLKYEPLLSHLNCRADLDFIFGEMLGELNAGHTYVNWGDVPQVARIDGGLLGAELQADGKSGRYRIAKIFRGENWAESTRSPLTELGVDVREGDFLIRLNGNEVTAGDNPYRFLENTAGKRVEIVVSRQADGQAVRSSWIKPVRSELGLRAMDWVDSRRRMVDELSGGRIGYIYVPDTAVDGNRELFKGVYAQSDKQAWIIDDRYNGGGWDPSKMVELLARRIQSYWHGRGIALRRDPVFALEGPKAMLINHYSSSGGDNFPYLFRLHKLGPLIGTRTWGGLVGYGWSPSLVDGPSFAVPMFGIVGTDGQWAVEGVGVAPDIEVYDRPELVAQGRDPSIEAAVKVLLEQLKKEPPQRLTKSPAEPDRSKWFEKEIK